MKDSFLSRWDKKLCDSAAGQANPTPKQEFFRSDLACRDADLLECIGSAGRNTKSSKKKYTQTMASDGLRRSSI